MSAYWTVQKAKAKRSITSMKLFDLISMCLATSFGARSGPF
jgi:hypothetical protein